MICTTAPHPLTASLSTAFMSACDIVSNRSSGSYDDNLNNYIIKGCGFDLTRSGFHSDSHIPYNCSEQVPATTKSVVSMGQPIRSIVAI